MYDFLQRKYEENLGKFTANIFRALVSTKSTVEECRSEKTEEKNVALYAYEWRGYRD